MVKTVLKQEGLNCKKKKCHLNLGSIIFQRKLHNYFKWKINYQFTLKIPEIIRTSTFIVKKSKNPHLNSKSLSELENSKAAVSLKQFLEKTQLIVKTNHSVNLDQLAFRMLKVFLATADDFNRQLFLVLQSKWPTIFVS